MNELQPTCTELFEDEARFKCVSTSSSLGFRHGTIETQVFQRLGDNTYWMAIYQLSTDGETNGLREGTASIKQVNPVEKTVIVYV